MFTNVSFHRFKRFRDQDVPLKPQGVTLVAGGNNSGKSSLLHGLAVWEFCKTVIRAEKGEAAFLPGSRAQGLGLSGEEFSPINVPTLRHLWTNLDFQKRPPETDGYTLRIKTSWESDASEKTLEIGLSLANDRLFVKATSSTLSDGDTIPTVAYLPPFAGMTDKEVRVPVALRRRRIGEGLAGAVMRNILLDLQQRNEQAREELRGDRKKLTDADLRKLREEDPWELLQETIRTTFGAELVVSPFSEEYHSYIQVEIAKGTVSGRRLTRFPNYKKRDIMVEGSGFLQWLSVYALAADPKIDVLLLDEPDAHLHPALQEELIEHLDRLATVTGKQVLIATHSSEILRHTAPADILEVHAKRKPQFLRGEDQKVAMLHGMGSDYAPKIDRIKKTRKVLFLEGTSDLSVIDTLGSVIGKKIPQDWVVWFVPSGHKERKQVFRALSREIDGLTALSLIDRDEESPKTVDEMLNDIPHGIDGGFTALKWKRRHIESYIIHPTALAKASGCKRDDVEATLKEEHALAIGENFRGHEVPQSLRDSDGKSVLRSFGVRAADVAAEIPQEQVPEDIYAFFERLGRGLRGQNIRGQSKVHGG